MDRLRQLLDRVRGHLGALTATQKLLIGSLAVIIVMGLFLVSQYAGGRDMVELMDADPQQELVRVLRAADIPAEVRNGKVMVPTDSRRFALASLAESGALPDNTALLFNNLIDRQRWTNSREQNEQLYLIALQNELSRVISSFRGVRAATVILDVPKATGIGLVVREPTASATIFTPGGAPLSQATVDAVAHLIAGARSGLNVRNIRVIDGSNGRQLSASAEHEMAASTYLEHAAAVENRTREKLLSLLSHVPGVIVAVTAQVDIAREDVRITAYASPDDGGTVSLLATENTRTMTQSASAASGEPGLRSNVTADVNRGVGSGTRSETSETETSMENRFGSTVTHRIDPKGRPTRLVASVNVPRGYVIEALRHEGVEEPGEERIRLRWEDLRRDFETLLRPHLGTDQAPGEVAMALIPVSHAVTIEPHKAGIIGGLGGGLLASGRGLTELVALGLLGLVSIALMFMLVRRAGRDPRMPTAQELVGVPPSIDTPSDLVGDVGETEEAMEGIEIGEGEVARSKMLEQVREMVAQSPDTSAALLNRWISPEE